MPSPAPEPSPTPEPSPQLIGVDVGGTAIKLARFRQDGELLAEAHHAPVAYRVGSAWGVQFHPEVDADILARMFADVGYDPECARPYVDEARRRADALQGQAIALFDRFWADSTT